MAALYSHTTRATGTTLTAAIYNADHENHITNGIPGQLDDYSASQSQMQTATDPGEVGTESLPTSLAGEIERLRFAIKEAKTVLGLTAAQWYSTPTGAVSASFGGVPTGTMFPYVGATAPTGYVRANGRTIGSASSSATERANADTQTLYELLWNQWADAQAPVSTGRGASAAADFAANKTITLPDLRGRAVFGTDDMGNAAASRITNAVSGITATTIGNTGGSQLMHQHNHTATDSGHTHGPGSGTQFVNNGAPATGSGYTTPGTDTLYFSAATASGTANITVANSGTGSSQNIPPALVTTWIIKL